MRPSNLVIVIIVICSMLFITCAPSERSIEDFGFNSTSVNGVPAEGQRPLLVIMMNFSDNDFTAAHDKTFYRDLIFGPYGVGSFGSDPGNVGEQHGFFEENSYDKFRFYSAGVLGPFENPDDPETPADESKVDESTPEGRESSRKNLGNAIKKADEAGFDFSRYDTNSDGMVTRDELTILTIWAGRGNGGSSRSTIPRRISVNEDLSVQTTLGGLVAQNVGVATLAHELVHLLGIGWEVYGSSCRNNRFSTMSCTIIPGRVDSRQIYHIDPLIKMKLGWLHPQIIETSADQCIDLKPSEFNSDAYIIHESGRESNEFFMLEYRHPRLNPPEDGIGPEILRNYDEDPWGTGMIGLPDDAGLGIWYTRLRDNKNPVSFSRADRESLPLIPTGNEKNDRALYLIPPKGSWGEPLGGDGLWKASDGATDLRWPDSTSTGTRVEVIGEHEHHREGGTALRVKIGDAECSLKEEEDEPDLTHPCINDPGLRETRCHWPLSDFTLERTITPWPIEPGQELTVKWIVHPGDNFQARELNIADSLPPGWTTMNQQESAVRFNRSQMSSGKEITESYSVVVREQAGAGYIRSAVTIEPAPSDSDDKLSPQPGSFMLESMHNVWAPHQFEPAAPPDDINADTTSQP